MASVLKNYQKPLLLIVALFALITFSATQAMTGFFDTLMRGPEKNGVLTLADGRDYQITADDQRMARDLYNMFVLRFPMINGRLGLTPEKELMEQKKEGEKLKDENPYYRTLILYCLAKNSGLDVPKSKVADFATSPIAQYYLKIKDNASYRTWVQRMFSTSTAHFEQCYRECLRLNFYLDAISLGENSSTLSVLEKAQEEAEEYKVEVVRWEASSYEPALKKEKVADEKLTTFLAELEPAEKADFVDSKVVDLEVAYVGKDTTLATLKKSIADGKPAKGAPAGIFLEYLEKLSKITDPMVENFYDQNKDTLYRKPVKPEVTKPDQADAEKKDEPKENPDGKQKADKPAVPEVEYLPLDEKLKAEIRTHLELNQALRLIFDEVKKAAAAAPPSDGQVKPPTEPGDVDPVKFTLKDFLAKNFPMLKYSRTGLLREEKLSELDILKGWAQSMQVLAVPEGDFLFDIYNSDTSRFFARVAQVKENEPRPLAEIRDDLFLVYVKKEAKKKAEKAAKDFIALLKKKSRAAQPVKTKEIEDQIKTVVDTRFNEIKAKLENEIKAAQAIIADKSRHAAVRQDYTKALEKYKADLAKVADKRKDLQEKEEEKRKEDLDELAFAKAGEFFTPVAKEVDVRLIPVDFFPKNLYQIDADAVTNEKDDAIRFVKGLDGIGKLKELEKGKVSELMEDPTNKAYLVAKVVDRRLSKIENLTPKEVDDQVRSRLSEASNEFVKKFLDFDSLKARYNFRDYRGEDDEKKKKDDGLEPAPESKDEQKNAPKDPVKEPVKAPTKTEIKK